MNIGFFGGSFDPPHRGHVALGRLAIERLRLDRLLVAPVGVQPLKRDRPGPSAAPSRLRAATGADFHDRVAMTRLAIEQQPHMEVSLLDAPRPHGRPNYTIDTIHTLRAELDPGDQIFCLMGADSFLSIGHWHRAADLLLTCDFIVAARPGFDLSRLTAALPPGISVAACDPPHPESEQSGVLALGLRGHGQRETRLCLLPDLADDASASEIRAALHDGGDTTAFLAPAVAAYIREHHLYRHS